MVALALIRLRKTEPNLYRPFKVPLYPYLPIIAIAALLFMIITMSWEALVLGITFGGVGLLLLFVSRRIKKTQKREETVQ
jgi:amino acid transporter